LSTPRACFAEMLFFSAVMPRRQKPHALRLRKRRFVRSEIWNTAIDLFAKRGYDATTVDEIAAAAGVSRRTFFRYFSSKDDLMVQATDTYGDILTEAIREAGRLDRPLEVVKRAVLRVADFVVIQPAARKTMQIVEENAAARGAQLSEFAVIERRVAAAFASAFQSSSTDDCMPELLASLTFVTLKQAFNTWYHHQPERISDTVEEIFDTLIALTPDDQARRARRPGARVVRRTLRATGPTKASKVRKS
jgi:AcrR family transcriptional regulator